MNINQRLLAGQRRDLIRAILDDRGAVRTADLAEELGVTQITVRRDLLALQEAGVATMVHGGARSTRARIPPADRRERSVVEVAAKQSIARAASGRIQERDAVFVDSGTTCAALVPFLAAFHRLTVVTTDLSTATALATAAPHLEVLAAGGRVDAATSSVQGELVAAFLDNFAFDVAFISATAWDGETGATTGAMAYAASKRSAASHAREVVLLVDSTKYGIAEPHVIRALPRFDAVVTDAALAGVERRLLEGAGVTLSIADAD